MNERNRVGDSKKKPMAHQKKQCLVKKLGQGKAIHTQKKERQRSKKKGGIGWIPKEGQRAAGKLWGLTVDKTRGRSRGFYGVLSTRKRNMKGKKNVGAQK